MGSTGTLMGSTGTPMGSTGAPFPGIPGNIQGCLIRTAISTLLKEFQELPNFNSDDLGSRLLHGLFSFLRCIVSLPCHGRIITIAPYISP